MGKTPMQANGAVQRSGVGTGACRAASTSNRTVQRHSALSKSQLENARSQLATASNALILCAHADDKRFLEVTALRSDKGGSQTQSISSFLVTGGYAAQFVVRLLPGPRRQVLAHPREVR
jgi:hypothetical protein